MESFEEKHLIQLPTHYKAIANSKTVHTLNYGDEDWYVINLDELEYYLQESSETQGFPQNGLPIAHNRSGDYLFIFPILNTNECLSILFIFKHETEEVFALEELGGIFSAIK